MSRRGRPARTETPAFVPDAELEEVIDFWTDASTHTSAELREVLQRVQSFFEESVFESHWRSYAERSEQLGFAVVGETETVLVLRDPNGGWERLFDRLGVDDPTTRKLVRLVHARVRRQAVPDRLAAARRVDDADADEDESETTDGDESETMGEDESETTDRDESETTDEDKPVFPGFVVERASGPDTVVVAKPDWLHAAPRLATAE